MGGLYGGFGPLGDRAALSKILSITEQELATQLDAGKSLADIAQDKGISEDQLVNSIKDNMTSELKKFVERKHLDLPAQDALASTDSSATASTTAN